MVFSYTGKHYPLRTTTIQALSGVTYNTDLTHLSSPPPRHQPIQNLINEPDQACQDTSLPEEIYLVLLRQHQGKTSIILAEKSETSDWPHYVCHPGEPRNQDLGDTTQQLDFIASELGIENIRLVGNLRTYQPPSGEKVTPYIAVIEDPNFSITELNRNGKYANYIETPIDAIFQKMNHTQIIGGDERLQQYYEVAAIEGIIPDEHLYGITAMVLRDLAQSVQFSPDRLSTILPAESTFQRAAWQEHVRTLRNKDLLDL